jgi:hypothetical protein
MLSINALYLISMRDLPLFLYHTTTNLCRYHPFFWQDYYLYYATSSRRPGKKYPVCEQTYIGKITEDGVVSDRVSINVGKTPARTLKELIPDLKGKPGQAIALHVKKEWILTQTDKEILKELEERGICHDGKVILRDI